jgi:hypothetical protein
MKSWMAAGAGCAGMSKVAAEEEDGAKRPNKPAIAATHG